MGVEPSDEQLAKSSIQGDTEAFGILVHRLRGPLIGYITGLLGRREEAEETAQEAFLAAWQHIGSLREPARMGGWIYRIAHNLATKRVDRNQTLPLNSDPPAPVCDGRRRESTIGLLAAVSKLSEPHREVIARKHFSGASGDEIAQQLGIPPGTVRSRLSRAYAELRAILREQEEDGA
jgi:RNA polymerase sigma-70 factor (ECF subfamily)